VNVITDFITLPITIGFLIYGYQVWKKKLNPRYGNEKNLKQNPMLLKMFLIGLVTVLSFIIRVVLVLVQLLPKVEMDWLQNSILYIALELFPLFWVVGFLLTITPPRKSISAEPISN